MSVAAAIILGVSCGIVCFIGLLAFVRYDRRKTRTAASKTPTALTGVVRPEETKDSLDRV